MADNNGKPPIPFPNADKVPIIGMPYALKGGFATVSLRCECAAKEPVLLVGGNPGFCPSCKRGFIIASFTFDQQTNQVGAQIGIVRVEPVGTPAGAPA